MKKTFLLLSATAISLAASAQTSRWDIDPTHSQVTFTATHLLITEVTGNFKQYSANVLADNADFSDAKVDFSIKVNSINTDNEMRDNHLKSDDFFNVEKFPEIIF